MCLKECPQLFYAKEIKAQQTIYSLWQTYTHGFQGNVPSINTQYQDLCSTCSGHRAVGIDHNAGSRKVQMIVAREVVLRAFTDDDKAHGEFMTERELQEMSQELKSLINVKK